MEKIPPFNPKKIYDELINRCKSVKEYYIECIVDESWTGFRGPAPFSIIIIDGIVACKVVALSQKEAMLRVVNNMPVLKFIGEYNDE
jgi:hypothetical protein